MKSMNNRIFAAVALTLGATFSLPALADDKAEFEAMKVNYQKAMEAAAKSNDVRGGLINACNIKYKKAVTEKILTQAESNKLCTCSVDAEGQVTNSDNWALQSAANAKDAKRFQQLQINMIKKQGDTIKSCVGTGLSQKLTKLMQQAQTAAAAPVPAPKK